MDDLIDEILAEMPDPIPEGQQVIDLDDLVPHPVELETAIAYVRCAEWTVFILIAKDEFEAVGATAVFSTWMVHMDDKTFDATMTDKRAA